MPAKHDGDLSTYDTRFIRCRGMRQHLWLFKTDFKFTHGPGGRLIEFTRTAHCAMCTADRDTKVKVHRNGSFEFMGHSYRYADGYQVTAHNAIPADAARDQLFMMEMKEAMEAELFNRLTEQRDKGKAARDAAAERKAREKRRSHLRAVGE